MLTRPKQQRGTSAVYIDPYNANNQGLVRGTGSCHD